MQDETPDAVETADADGTPTDADGRLAGEESSPAFDDLGLAPELLAELSALGYEEPTPIQLAAIPPLLEGHDLLGRAATGTGKTAAFALPLLQRLAEGTRPRRSKRPDSLVLVPTRELAMQVSEAVHRYGRGLDVRVLPVFGGQPIGRQLGALDRGVDVVVATPGRAVDLLKRGSLDLGEVAVVVLDEADEMLDMGFAEDLEAILGAAPRERRTVLFSATMPRRIDRLASTHLSDPVRIHIEDPRPSDRSAAQVRQEAYLVHRTHKAAALGRILDVEAPGAALVFCRTRVEVDQLTETLNGRGYRAEALHGGMGQDQRDRVMGRLRSGAAELLVATDVAARGLDVDTLTHVVNHDAPSSPETYVHRIGRVGRAGRDGVAITLATPRERRLLQNIESATRQRIAIRTVPSVAELRSRRLELTADELAQRLAAGDLENYAEVLETLTAGASLRDAALAAIAVAHETGSGSAVDDEEIPAVRDRSETRRDRARPDSGRGDAGRGSGRDGPPERSSRQQGGRKRTTSGRGGGTKVFVSAGRAAGVRPGDLVGAITGETSLGGGDIGAIEIAEKFALVEVPDGAVDEVVAALRGTTLRGRKVQARRDRFGGAGG